MWATKFHNHIKQPARLIFTFLDSKLEDKGSALNDSKHSLTSNCSKINVTSRRSNRGVMCVPGGTEGNRVKYIHVLGIRTGIWTMYLRNTKQHSYPLSSDTIA
jgi:hypothetical protein